MTYEVIHHTDSVKPEAWVVFVRKAGKLERATYLGKRGGFKTREEAEAAAFNAAHYGTQKV
jgi:hypothetical protein